MLIQTSSRPWAPRKNEIGTGYRLVIFLLTTVSVLLLTTDTLTPSLFARFLTVTTDGVTEVTRKTGSDHWKVSLIIRKFCRRGAHRDDTFPFQHSLRSCLNCARAVGVVAFTHTFLEFAGNFKSTELYTLYFGPLLFFEFYPSIGVSWRNW